MLSKSWMRLTLIAVVAVTVSFLAARATNHIADPIPAAITALVTIRPIRHQALKEGTMQFVGALIGAGLGLAAIAAGTNPYIVFPAVALASYLIAGLLRLGNDQGAVPIAITAIIVAGAGLSFEGAEGRVLGVLIGAIVGAVCSVLLAERTSAVRTVRERLDDIALDVASLLEAMGERLPGGTPSSRRTRAWFDEAVALRERHAEAAAEVESILEHRRWMRANPRDLVALTRHASTVSVLVNRAVSIASDLNHISSDPGSPDLPAAAYKPLALVVAAAAEAIRDEQGGDSPISDTAVSQAVSAGESTEEILAVGALLGHAQRIARAGSQVDVSGGSTPGS